MTEATDAAVADPRVSRGPVDRGLASLNAPQEAVMLDVEGDLQDDAVFRRFVARQLATQTLAQQRTEWYTRSARLHVMAAFWISMTGTIAMVILLIALVSVGNEASSVTFP